MDDILNEVNKLHLTTLKHAADISPLVHDRTIGADIDPIQYKDNETINNDLTKSDKNEINRKKTPSKEKLVKSPVVEKLHKEPNSLHVSLFFIQYGVKAVNNVFRLENPINTKLCLFRI